MKKKFIKILTQAYIDFNYIDHYYDLDDFEFPIKSHFNSLIIQCSNNFLVRGFLHFIENEIKTDFGWILDTFETKTYNVNNL